MPFTAAHTAAVLPWARNHQLSSTALIAGSMAPDFEYFIRINVQGIWGHDLVGIFLFDVPVTLCLVVLFHLVVKCNFIDNLPVFLQRRFSHLKELSVREDIIARPITFFLCAVAGALTHVLWDSFTHNEGYFVNLWRTWYDARVVPFRGVSYPLWYALQQISTAVGMIILITYILFMKPAGKAIKPGFLYWLLLSGIAAAVVFLRYQFPHPQGLPMLAISIISGLCIGVVILGLLPSRKELAVE